MRVSALCCKGAARRPTDLFWVRLLYLLHLLLTFISLKIVAFSSLFSKPKKLEKRPPRLPKNDKSRSRNSSKTISMKSRFLQYLPCENNDLEGPPTQPSRRASQNVNRRWPWAQHRSSPTATPPRSRPPQLAWILSWLLSQRPRWVCVCVCTWVGG